MFFMCCVFMSAATTVLFEGKQALDWSDGVQIVREVATAISHITTSAKADNAIYSIDGRKLNAVPQHGLYIMNGKKHVAR